MLKILVVGVRSAKAHELTLMYKGKIKFKFITDQDKSTRKQKGLFDHIVSCTKFTSHYTEELYSDHVGYVRISGGVTNLYDTINRLYQSSLGEDHV